MNQALIVEDQIDAQDWLSAVLRHAFADIEPLVTDCLSEARAALEQHVIELALVDLHLPDGWGGDLIRDIKAKQPDCPCIITTIYDDDEHLFPALRAGADGYLLKTQPQERLEEQLHRMLEGEPPLSPSIARRLLSNFRPDPAESSTTLTEREREVLILISQGWTLPQVAECLSISRNTAAAHLKKVYRKLEVHNRAEASLEAVRRGLIS